MHQTKSTDDFQEFNHDRFHRGFIERSQSTIKKKNLNNIKTLSSIQLSLKLARERQIIQQHEWLTKDAQQTDWGWTESAKSCVEADPVATSISKPKEPGKVTITSGQQKYSEKASQRWANIQNSDTENRWGKKTEKAFTAVSVF